jgi:CHAT domain-containing protein
LGVKTLSAFARFIAPVVFLAMAVYLLVFATDTVNHPSVITLLAGSSWERPITQHETHSYELNLQAGELARVEVCQRDIDIHLSLMKADGSRLPDMDGSEWGTEALSVLASKTGVYRIGVAANEHDSARGTYVITVCNVRPAVPSDQKGEQAQDRFAQGMREISDDTAESMAEAVRSFEVASALWHAAGDRHREGQALNRLGFVCQRIGRYDQAVDSFGQALRIWQELKDDYGLAETWPQLANASGHFGVAVRKPSSPEMLRLWKRLGDRRGQALALDGLAREARDAGDLTKASDYEAQALTLRETLGNVSDVASSVEDLAFLKLWLKRPAEAFELAQRALSTYRNLRNSAGEAACLALIGQTLLNAGRLPAAISYFEQSLQLRRRQGDRSAVASTLLVIAATELRLGSLRTALAHIRESIVVEESLAAMIHEPERRVGFLGERYSVEVEIQILMALSVQEPRSDYAVQALLLADRSRGRYLSDRLLAQPAGPSLAAVRRELDEKTLLLEYWLGNDETYLWALTSHDLLSYLLPSRKKIVPDIRRLLTLWSARNSSARGESEAVFKSRIRQLDAEYPVVAESLAKTLLGPVADQLGRKRILVVTDGILEDLPFAALPDLSRRDGTLMVDNHEIVNLPSVATVLALRRKHAHRGNTARLLAVIADPVFDVRDPRLGKADRPHAPLESGLVRAASAARLDVGAGVPRLPFARQEAQTILDLVPRGQATQFMDFDASRETVLAGQLRPFRIVHIATHAFANTEDGDLSGLVLSLVDRQGQPIKGFLHAGEVFQLDLPADLVVLSACQTALGRDIHGEGVVGLTSAFLHAGAARVLSSAWQVDDEATAELMREFYRVMLARRSRTPAAALREAQLAIARHERWRSPYYWAGFLMNGDWR